MAIKIVCGYNDPEWDSVKDMFYDNFDPDDWDYIIIGSNKQQVEDMAYKLQVCDYRVREINEQWVAVTYHS
jgi:hypothetical protein